MRYAITGEEGKDTRKNCYTRQWSVSCRLVKNKQTAQENRRLKNKKQTNIADVIDGAVCTKRLKTFYSIKSKYKFSVLGPQI